MKAVVVAIVLLSGLPFAAGQTSSVSLETAERQYVEASVAATRIYRLNLAKALRSVQSARVFDIENAPVKFEDAGKLDSAKQYFEVPAWHEAFPIITVRDIAGGDCQALMESLAAALAPEGDDLVLPPLGFLPAYGLQVSIEGKERVFVIGSGQIVWFPPHVAGFLSDSCVVESIPSSSDFERRVDWILKEKKPNQAPEPTATLVTPRAGARVAPSAAVAHL